MQTIKHTSDEPGLVHLVLQLAVTLEQQSRTMLIDALDSGSKASTLLVADRNLSNQIETELYEHARPSPADRQAEAWIEKIHQLEQDPTDATEEEVVDEEGDSPLERVRKYRLTYAALLAAGTRLMELQGDDRWYFEKRHEKECVTLSGLYDIA